MAALAGAWRKLLDGLDAESIHKIVRGNAIDLFELQGFQ